ncbi:hypothetical protein RND71_006333 [Anisodus tanguticus]|uniref:Uncharacterized protein n=1 Tax=Anisodus tanguticus TaxID=243964 RepID=A0AAE1VT43_9SOLA|nr:hypothetical protein RND71_006333 [Anisodus tanguticus]
MCSSSLGRALNEPCLVPPPVYHRKVIHPLPFLLFLLFIYEALSVAILNRYILIGFEKGFPPTIIYPTLDPI